DMPVVTLLLHVVMVCLLVLAARHGGMPAFAVASLWTLTLHAILKRLNDTRLESERRREELVTMQSELDRRQRLAMIGQTAATVFHGPGRHAAPSRLPAPPPTPPASPAARAGREPAARISTSVDDATRVIEELLRFCQDPPPTPPPPAVPAVLAECADECA